MVSLSLTPSDPLIPVDAARAELRRGLPVIIQDPAFAPLAILAAETARDEGWRLLRAMASPSTPRSLVLPASRAADLGLMSRESGFQAAAWISLALSPDVSAALIETWIDPTETPTRMPQGPVLVLSSASSAVAGIRLAKLSGLLPAIIVMHLPDDFLALKSEKWICVTRDQILTYSERAARALRKVGEAQVPLADAESSKVVAFRPQDGGIEHLALVVGSPRFDLPVLTRIHSQCVTGDLLGSLRCDCGDQLRGAIATLAAAGGGVLLYLAQEGRGIGLVNKLRAYCLQDRGADTVEANLSLGFDEDERTYVAATVMLHELGIARVRLLTNNPHKVEALSQAGIEVVERVPHRFPSNPHNQGYLETKAKRAGHIL